MTNSWRGLALLPTRLRAAESKPPEPNSFGERSSRFDAKAAGFIRQGFLEHPPHALVHTLRQLLVTQPPIEALAPGLGKLELPVLVVVGADDAEARAAARVLAEHVRNLRLELVEGAGHVVNLAAPTAFNAALREFLTEMPR